MSPIKGTARGISLDPSTSEVRKKLKAAGNGLEKALQKVFKKHATHVAVIMKDKYDEDHHQVSGEGLKSIRPYATQTSASVQIGSAKAPYMLGQNFGANGMARFPSRGHPDYYLYENVYKELPSMNADHAKEVDALMKEAFPDA